MVEKLENLSLHQQAADPKRRKVVEDVMAEAQGVLDELDRWQREREDEERYVEAIERNLTTFLKAIDKSTKATNDLLVISEARLSQIEGELTNGDGFPIELDPNIVAEGAFLKAQLTGVEDTKSPGPLFKDALPVALPTGLEVLADAVNNAGTYATYQTSP
jgi:hypothetical protein